ncbi:MAG: hypothetical protein FJZ00_00635 [Candidatus Sericytochromatia bacterium]|uniref:Uncharacterized protein n=1 Tax=Candidatus Tanganyikabacteria bacterium TaxID=2961651 RepID=A0A937X3M1_9BACT|nr:hypothetical protein [Candidatus Tanganyikabacteria bacterium]
MGPTSAIQAAEKLSSETHSQTREGFVGDHRRRQAHDGSFRLALTEALRR